MTDKQNRTSLNFQEIELEAERQYHVFDFWTCFYMGCYQDNFICPEQPPHSARIYHIIPRTAGIQLIGNDIHAITAIKTKLINEDKLKGSYNSNLKNKFRKLYMPVMNLK